MKKFFFLLILLAAGGAAYFYYNRSNLEAKSKEPENEKKTLVVERGTIDLKVATTGKVVSNLDVDIKSKASGQIIELPFDISDSVTSGELLAELDPVDENRNVTQRMAALMSAQARLAQAKENLEMSMTDMDTGTSDTLASLESARVRNRDAQARLQRQESLYAKQLVSREALDAARTEAAAAEQAETAAEINVAELRKLPRTVELRRQDILLQEAQMRQAEVDLENAKQRLRETKIYAPMDGVITSRPVQTGQIIASGISNVGGGTTLMTLSDLSRLFVTANVDEADIGKVQVGQRAMITADAFPGKRFRGTVQRIATKGTNKSDVVTFEVKIEVDGEGRDTLRPEMTANIEIQADRKEDVLMLANEAIVVRPDGSYVEMEGTTETTKRVRIQTGITDGLRTEVVSGLEEKQTVLVPESMQSRWARGGEGGGPRGSGGSGGSGGSSGRSGSSSSDVGRTMRRATFSLGGSGGGRR